MSSLRIVKWSLLGLLVVSAGLFLHYNLPRTDVVQITGTDVKRQDRRAEGDIPQTRDVRYINTVTRAGKVRVFRNEDTGWGWPPYLKFDSADLTAEAQRIIQSPEAPWVRVRYYGWRIQVFSLFPNAVSIKIVDRDYTHTPAFNVVFLTLLAVGIFLMMRLGRSLLRKVGIKRPETGSE